MNTTDKICRHFDSVAQMDEIAVGNILREHDAEQQKEIDKLRAERQRIWELLPNPDHLRRLGNQLDAEAGGVTVDGPICRAWASAIKDILKILEPERR